MTTPAPHTRKEAMVSGGKWRRPIFAAMKLTAQITTINPINDAMTGRLGARPSEDSTSTWLDQTFFSHREFFDAIAARLEADARPGRHANRALRGDGHFRLDDVLIPIAFAGGNIAGQREIGKRRESDIVCSSDSRLQHSSAPHRHAVLLAQIVNTPCNGIPANSPELDVNNLART